jgi:two-component sensor histidine kinase
VVESHQVRVRYGGEEYALETNRDITERKRHEEQVSLLMHEVNHRSKNMLNIVQAVARQTAAARPNDFMARFTERLHALAASQDLLVKSAWRGVDLAELVRSQLAHFEDLIGRRIELQGPPISISASASQTIGMALHELATNSGKYGALSNECGVVEIAWDLERIDGEEAALVMSWKEEGGPPVTPQRRQGFGTTIIVQMAKTNLDAEVALDYAAAGLRWHLKCPAVGVLEGSQPRSAANEKKPSEGMGTDTGTAPCILVVEDDHLVALEIARILKQAGMETVGPARTVNEALELLKSKRCDAAILDVNLSKETSEHVAQELTRLKTPFLSVSGYSRAQLPPLFSAAPALPKPPRPELLIAEVKRCMGSLVGHKELSC